MVARLDIPQKVVIGKSTYLVNLIQNPTIDDVIITEMRIQAAAIEGSRPIPDDHVVARDIKNFLIRLGVDL